MASSTSSSNILRLFVAVLLCTTAYSGHPVPAASSSKDDTGVVSGTGKVYTKVCEAARVAALVLDMTAFQY
ncbi:hypothetical protein GUJ93_ZPchr0013g34553 [Zizania palustris]|uniref:Pectinesterase inhibitor domain-containing protein n=1 Tax=Zizania palustris TaxID=103762 RepID=A0A8J5X158_ZIZPA|nr:hypothetical protein GUJ93_ZPchr0013g34553 [Zizania palustris]